MTRAGCISVTHGGGPLPLIGDASQAQLAKSMRTRVPQALGIPSNPPKAILLLTAHWETDVATICSGSSHQLLFDYYGFPPETYEFEYKAPGSPEVAARVQQRLGDAGILSQLDPKRGWDHGMFVPMILVNDKADIPVVQMSVLASQSPKELYALGQALEPLRDENIAIVGSGSASFHNLRLLFSDSNSSMIQDVRKKFPSWMKAVHDAVGEADPNVRREKLEKWRDWDGAYAAHPRGAAEHFSPLIVCAGAGGQGAAKGWVDKMSTWDMETFYWN